MCTSVCKCPLYAMMFRLTPKGRVAGPFTSELAEHWARLALIGDDVPEAYRHASDERLAVHLNVPAEQVAKHRAESGAAGDAGETR